MCPRRGVIVIDLAGDQDVIIAGSASDGCECGGCTCADKRERPDKGRLPETDYATELMLIPVVSASLPKAWKGR